ncbi:hypothetical protein HRbin22_01211 [Candidatus Thermoflexus japonica]|uniref:Peptidase M4 n=1 Tax=Candidatus Thermoflexus japonica TaxID=2035417 RepID=A0A2H5Y697_9CHLR|nr:hypothetical protein HRbin22_01211 [Candidatus Thermoflexus japonica]
MNRWKIWIGLGLFAGLIIPALISAGMVRANIVESPAPYPAGAPITSTVPIPRLGFGGWWGMGPMMGHWGGGPLASQPLTAPAPFGGCPMMSGSWGPIGSTAHTPISDEEAVRIAREAIAAYGNPDLELAEVMAFDNHFYAQARERSTGRYAFEFLIDRYTGAVHPEPGPNMMWNTRYGMMGRGMMGGGFFSSGEMRLSPEEARQRAQAYLDRAMPGAIADEEADPFYGYYTLHILRDGRIIGMLSVHGSTGQVWVHTWHGNFLRMVYGHEGEH